MSANASEGPAVRIDEATRALTASTLQVNTTDVSLLFHQQEKSAGICEKQQKKIIYALNVIIFGRLNKYHISSYIPQRTGVTNQQSLHREIQEAQPVTVRFTFTAIQWIISLMHALFKSEWPNVSL